MTSFCRFTTAVLCLVIGSLAWGDSWRQELGIGMEAGLRFHQNQSSLWNGSGYDLHDSGSPVVSGLEVGPTISWDLEVLPPVSLGLRASLLVFGPSFPYDLVPRLNGRLKWSLSDAFAVVFEAPYSPGVGFELVRTVSLFVGTDGLLVPRSDFVVSTAVLYHFGL